MQAGHALAEFLLRGPSSDWNNGTLVCLGVSGLKQLENLKFKFDCEDIRYKEFREPDMNNQITAIATDQPNKYVERLNCI